MSEDVEKDEADERKRRRLFWILVVAIFTVVIVVWLSFFSDTVFNINTNATTSLFKDLGSYWNGAKEGFSNLFEQLSSTSTATTTATTTENQATSTQ
jgi:flagellar basal body-associated protein FliL